MVDSLSPQADGPSAGPGRWGRAARAALSWLGFIFFDRLLPVGVWAFLGSAVAAGLHAAWPHLSTLERLARCTTLLFMAMVLVLFLVRRRRRGRRAGGVSGGGRGGGGGGGGGGGRLVALAGTFLPWLVVAVPGPMARSGAVLLAAMAVAWAGLILSIVALAYLGRCFGLFPEARGLVMRGPYRWVRHPLYLGEILTYLGVVAGAFNWWGAATYAAFVTLQIWRAINEERALLAEFPEYRPYAAKTRRLLPGVW
jgi:protein-S-isoprenylcysteine O-methyltransferase Ste14